MTAQTYQKLIVEGLQELPEAALAEIADFVYFVRLRTQRETSAPELYSAILSLERATLSENSRNHLEEEFATYDRDFPRE